MLALRARWMLDQDDDSAPARADRLRRGQQPSRVHDGLADDLAALDILYAPDFVANAGGIINISVELESGGYDLEVPRAASRRSRTPCARCSTTLSARVSPLAAYALARCRLQEAEKTFNPTG